MEFGKALSRLWEVIGLLNRYIVASAPWELAKQPEAAGRLDSVLYHLLEGLRWIAMLLRPVMPRSALKMSEQLGLSPALWDQPFDQVLSGVALPPAASWPRARPSFPGSKPKTRQQGKSYRVAKGPFPLALFSQPGVRLRGDKKRLLTLSIWSGTTVP